jgi:hypothetical protein
VSADHAFKLRELRLSHNRCVRACVRACGMIHATNKSAMIDDDWPQLLAGWLTG